MNCSINIKYKYFFKKKIYFKINNQPLLGSCLYRKINLKGQMVRARNKFFMVVLGGKFLSTETTRTMEMIILGRSSMHININMYTYINLCTNTGRSNQLRITNEHFEPHLPIRVAAWL